MERHAGRGRANFRFSLLEDAAAPGNSGQFGLAAKHTFEAIDTEMGAYYVNYKTCPCRTFLGRMYYRRRLPGSVYYAQAPLGSVFWDYDVKNIQVAGISAATVIGGWAVAGGDVLLEGLPR